MAVEISVSKESRRLDVVVMTVSGTFNDDVLSTDLEVITPDGDVINVDLSPENFPIPTTLPFDRNITDIMLGLNTYTDGVYSFKYTVNYDDLTVEVTESSVVLFDNNAISSWYDLIEEHLILNPSCTDSQSKKRQESREMIQAAQEAFRLFRYNEANSLINGALEIINSCN